MTTLWDFGSIMRNVEKWPRIHDDAFFYYTCLFNSENKSFNDTYIALYDELAPTIFSRLSAFLNEFEQSTTAAAIQRSRPYEYARWGDYDNTSVAQNIEEMQQWLVQRQQWLSESIKNIPTSASGISNLSQPPAIYQQPINLLGLPIAPRYYRGIIIQNGKKVMR